MPLTPTTAPPRRLAVTLALALALALAGLLALAGPASAHADLVSSSPPDGAVVAGEPGQVTLVFSEAVTLRLSAIKVIGPDGRRVDSGAPRTVGSGAERVTVDLAADPHRGTFVLDWRATAADDGHTTSGSLTFSVGAPSRTTVVVGFGAPDRVTDAVLDLAIWTGLAGLALLVGCAAIRLHCLPAADAGDLRWPATLGWTALFAGTLVQLFAYGPATQGKSLARILDRSLLSATLSTHEGHVLVARIILLALVATVGELLLRRRARPGAVAGAAVAAVLALALAATWSEISHASSGSLVPLALVVTTLHVTAMAVWAGGLFTIVVLLTRGSGGADADLGGTTARFSRLALGSVAVLAATGLYQAFREVGSFAELTGTSYGRLLLVKAGVFLLVIAVAAVSRSLVAGARERSTAALRRSVLLELAGVTVVLVLTVFLIGSAPAREAHSSTATGSGTRALQRVGPVTGDRPW
ncbi:copper resistance CopC/CopD family protein [Streptacidiphilus sp. P02-A3a]|uniref:copper resistance CopC/CopD family protein n=1 Tax=Streptacidiphilus sp. P02-A3a TaxID=2704468 RepID=UPI0015FE483A|nr:copper resistance protein CopC [Streptacidiphilus sp. P02-A3a]QMU71574.1 copper resistance protein CopC/CopD [Streptacidiphilus sp. P02-A3a]